MLAASVAQTGLNLGRIVRRGSAAVTSLARLREHPRVDVVAGAEVVGSRPRIYVADAGVCRENKNRPVHERSGGQPSRQASTAAQNSNGWARKTWLSCAPWPQQAQPMTADEKRVIFASSLGTIFEWYDFYLFGVLTAVIGAQFFAPLDESTRNIFTLLAFAAGFAVRPFGAIVFGPARRHGGSQAHVLDHDLDHGIFDVRAGFFAGL